MDSTTSKGSECSQYKRETGKANSTTSSDSTLQDDERMDEVVTDVILDEESTMTSFDYRAILRKIDVRLLPYTILLNALSYLDKYNLSQAHARDLDDDLHLEGNQFATLLSVYFPAFLVLHYIAGAFVQQLRTRRFIPSLVLLCGLITTLMCRAATFYDMAAGRFLLGVFEGAITPCITILYTSWYPSQHMATRVTLFRLAAPLAGMASALVCAGFYMIDGVEGLDGWRWMFLSEGLLTVVLAIPGFWLVPNFIEQDGDDVKKERRYMQKRKEDLTTIDRAKRAWRMVKPPAQMLTDEERTQWSTLLVRQTGPMRRLTAFSWRQILRPFVDVKMILFFVIGGANQIVHSNMVNFAPEVIKGLGFQGSSINFLSAGPLAFSVITMLVTARISDWKQVRGLVLLPCLFITLIGQILLIANVNYICSYTAIFLVAGFSYPCNGLLYTWCSSNVGPQYTKNSCMAILMVASTATALVSANVFPREDAPLYTTGHSIGLVSILLANAAIVILLLLIKWENRKRQKAFPLELIDKEVLHAALQYDLLVEQSTKKPSNDNIDNDDNDATTVTPVRAAAKTCQTAMTDAEAQAFWHLTHLSSEEFACLGDRHPGIRLNY